MSLYAKHSSVVHREQSQEESVRIGISALFTSYTNAFNRLRDATKTFQNVTHSPFMIISPHLTSPLLMA